MAATGLFGIFASAMIYAVTGREFWNFVPTIIKFGLTSAVLGIAAMWLSILLFSLFDDSPGARLLSDSVGPRLVQLLIVCTAAKLIVEGALFRFLLDRRNSPLKRSARLLTGTLSTSLLARWACGLLGGIAMPLLVPSELLKSGAPGPQLVISVGMLVTACIIGELLERYHFFAACSAPRMPGGLRT